MRRLTVSLKRVTSPVAPFRAACTSGRVGVSWLGMVAGSASESASTWPSIPTAASGPAITVRRVSASAPMPLTRVCRAAGRPSSGSTRPVASSARALRSLTACWWYRLEAVPTASQPTTPAHSTTARR